MIGTSNRTGKREGIHQPHAERERIILLQRRNVCFECYYIPLSLGGDTKIVCVFFLFPFLMGMKNSNKSTQHQRKSKKEKKKK
jgi:hypothetical protein